jgi:hypothetical protein
MLHKASTGLFRAENDRGCSPIADRVEIEGEIAIPFPAHRVPIIFSWAKSDP